jgi:hypothetical protein
MSLALLRAQKAEHFDDWIVAINVHGATSPAAIEARTGYRSALAALAAAVNGDAVAGSLPHPLSAERAQRRTSTVSPVVHERAKRANYRRAKAFAFEEACHAVAFASEDQAVEYVCFDYYPEASSGIAGGTCRPGPGVQCSAVVAVAGRLGARMAGYGDQHRFMSHDVDRGLLAAAIARSGSWSVPERDRAEKRARDVLAVHWGAVEAVADALMATGSVEGAELGRLLAPVRAHAQRSDT